MAFPHVNFIAGNQKKPNASPSREFCINDFYEDSIVLCPCIREEENLDRFTQVTSEFSDKYSTNCRIGDNIIRGCRCCGNMFMLSKKQLIASMFSRDGYICNTCHYLGLH